MTKKEELKLIWFYIKNWFQNKNGVAISIIFFSSTLIYLIIIFNLYKVQIKNHSKYLNISNNLNKHRRIEEDTRASIYFQNNSRDIIAGTQQKYYWLILDNKDNKFLNHNNLNLVYKKLTKYISIPKKKFFKLANQKNKAYIILNKNISETIKEKIQKEKIKYIYFDKQFKRYYPFDELGSKIIGFTNAENNGVTGLEKKYNSTLKIQEIKEKNKILSLINQNIDNLQKKELFKRQGDIYTSIDINVENFLTKKIQEINNKYHSKKTFGIIMKPGNGEIVAIADNEKLNFNLKKEDYRNDIVESRYEPGSIIKPLIVALALDSGYINKDFKYNDTGCILIQNKKICNFDKRGRGPNTNLTRIIRDSLNVGMVNIEKKIPKKVFLEYFIKLGLSEESGIDLPNEISPNINTLNYKINLNYATAAFGQGISLSPIVTLRALSILANNGYLVTPHLVTKIKYKNYILDKKIEYPKTKVLKDKTMKEIQQIMIRAVENSPSKQKYVNKYYNVAAKTGTAQIAKPGGGYKKGTNLHTFFGFFPAKAPVEDRYIILLYTLEPKGVRYSSQTLTKPFFEIMDFLISYYNIKSDKLK